MSYEIEVKAKLRDLESTKSKICALGCVFSAPIIQHDFIYNQKGIKVEMRHKTPVLRIRKQNDKTIFTVKQDRANELDCIERELTVSDGDTMQEIFKMLGYTKTVEVKKIRMKTKYKDYEICLDEVDGLGSFIEVEKISSESADKVQKELFDFLISLGVSKEDRVVQGYDSMIWEKGYTSDIHSV